MYACMNNDEIVFNSPEHLNDNVNVDALCPTNKIDVQHGYNLRKRK